jgi:hypothetical protein
MKNTYIVLVGVVVLLSCSKHSSSTNNSAAGDILGYGHFGFNDYSAGFDGVINGWTDTGAGKITGNIDITIFEPNMTKGWLTIYNMPSDSSGTFTIYDAEDSSGIIGSAKLYLGYTGYSYAEDTTKYSKSGTVTKTATGSFTFTCTMGGFDIPNPTTGYGYYSKQH